MTLIKVKSQINMKLYTEKQLRDAVKSALNGIGIQSTDDISDVILSKMTPILVPKLPDIKEAANDLSPLLLAHDKPEIFIEGAAWTAVQIKEQIMKLNHIQP